MKIGFRRLVAAAVLSLGLVLTSSTAQAQSCQPDFNIAYNAHLTDYNLLTNALISYNMAQLYQDFNAVADQGTYETLRVNAQGLANTVVNGRVVITLPDGTVVLDTSKGNPGTNTFANFQAKTINENHNSRVAIFAAQQYPCGYALERKFSSSTGVTETYFAARLGNYLDNIGTIRISTK